MRVNPCSGPDSLDSYARMAELSRSRSLRVTYGFCLKALGLALMAALLVCSTAAQNYIYGQASLQTGAKPSGLTAADFNGDGRPDLAAANQSDNTVSVMLTNPDGTFAPRVSYKVGNSPVQIVTSDFNGDGFMDLAVVNSADNTVSVLFGVGDGTFKNQMILPTGKTPVAITVGDFNGDGNADLAIADQGDNTVLVLLGDGKGSFVAQTPIALSAAPYYILAGDTNNDGKADLFVLAGATNSTDTLFLLISAGNGSFSLGSSGGIGQGTSVVNFALGDFNNDGNLDVAFASPPNYSVSILMGNGAGSFSSTSLSINGPLAPPQSIVVGDFNHDGNLDFAVTETYFIAVYPGNGNGAFGSPILCGIPFYALPVLLFPADFNNDGELDLAEAVPEYNVAVVLLGNGDGSLGSRADVTLPASGGLAGAVVADLNNDGKEDLAVAQFDQPPSGSIQGFIATLLGNGDGTLQQATSSSPSDLGISELISADFTGNGVADLASADVNGDGGIAVFLGNGNGTFGSPIDSFMGGATPMNPGPIAAGDFNGDGKMDLILASEDSGNNSSPLYVLLSQGDGTFSANAIYNLPYGFVPDVKVADLNGDGVLDLAVTTQDTLLVFLGNGDGSFQAPIHYTNTALFTNSVAVGDFNGDGKLDIVVGVVGSTSGEILFYAGNGDGTFQSPVSSPTLINLITLVAGDFNGDGILDLASEGPGLGDSILIGNGDGTFQDASPFEPTYYPRTYTKGDLNGDGVIDLVQFSTRAPTGTPPQTATVWLSAPVVSLTATSLQFGTQNVGTTGSPKVIQLSNPGNAPLLLTNISVSGSFSQTNTCPNSLAIKQSCSIQVTFAPTTNGTQNGSLTLTDNVKSGTQSVALTGLAATPDFVPSISPSSVTVKAGSSATYALLLTSSDGFAGTVQVSCSGAPAQTNCMLSPQSVQLAANGTATVQVTVSTTAASSAGTGMIAPRTLNPIPWLHSARPLISLLSIFFVCVLIGLTMQAKVRMLGCLSGLACMLALAGCGGGSSVSGSGSSGPPAVVGTAPGSYVLALTMVSGASTHSVTVTLVVQ